MSNGINKVMLVGNLGRDPEARSTPSGLAITQLSVAVSERRKDGDGWTDHTEWVRVVAFGKTAEHAAQFLQKGRQVFVEGRLQTKAFQDKQGVEKQATEVIADRLVFLGGPRQEGEAPRPRAAPRPALAS